MGKNINKYVIAIVFILFLIPLTFAALDIKSSTNKSNKVIDIVTATTSSSSSIINNTNSSDYWDSLDNPSDINIFLLRNGSNTVTGNINWNDNIGIYFGGGEDARVYYDGTNLVINPRYIGNGFLNLLSNLSINNQSLKNVSYFEDSAGLRYTLADLNTSSGSPGGSNTEIQYNYGGIFNGTKNNSNSMTWEGSYLLLTGDKTNAGLNSKVFIARDNVSSVAHMTLDVRQQNSGTELTLLTNRGNKKALWLQGRFYYDSTHMTAGTPILRADDGGVGQLTYESSGTSSIFTIAGTDPKLAWSGVGGSQQTLEYGAGKIFSFQNTNGEHVLTGKNAGSGGELILSSADVGLDGADLFLEVRNSGTFLATNRIYRGYANGGADFYNLFGSNKTYIANFSVEQTNNGDDFAQRTIIYNDGNITTIGSIFADGCLAIGNGANNCTVNNTVQASNGDIVANNIYANAFFGRSPALLCDSGSCLIFDGVAQESNIVKIDNDWNVINSDKPLTSRMNEKFIKLKDEKVRIETEKKLNRDIEICKKQYNGFGNYNAQTKRCTLDEKKQCESKEWQFWDGNDCKENLKIKCNTDMRKTNSWNELTMNCEQDPSKMCELQEDYIWDRENQKCNFSQEERDSRLMQECEKDKSKIWNVIDGVCVDAA